MHDITKTGYINAIAPPRSIKTYLWKFEDIVTTSSPDTFTTEHQGNDGPGMRMSFSLALGMVLVCNQVVTLFSAAI